MSGSGDLALDTGPQPYGETDARAYLLQRYDLVYEGRAAPFAIVATDGGALAGSLP